MKKIYWASQHSPLPCQIQWLEKHFKEKIEIVKGLNTNAEKIVNDFKKKNCEEMVVVAPLWVIYHIIQNGIKPLWADMQEVAPSEKYDLKYRGRCYKFNGFKRIEEIKIIYSDL